MKRTKDEILSDPAVSYWAKAALVTLGERDVCNTLADLELLTTYFTDFIQNSILPGVLPRWTSLDDLMKTTASQKTVDLENEQYNAELNGVDWSNSGMLTDDEVKSIEHGTET